MDRREHLDAVAVLAMLVLCASWGFNQVVVKTTNQDISPLMQAGLRSCIAAILVLGWSRARGIRLFERDGTLPGGILAGLLFALEFAFVYWGLNFTTASRSVIFLYMAPFVVAVGAHAWLGERLTAFQIAGLLAAFSGVVVAFAEAMRLPSSREIIGDMMLLCAAFLWGATTLIVRMTKLARASAEKTLIYQLGVSALLLPLASLALGEPGIVNLSGRAIGSLAFQGIWVAFASYLTWFWLITRYPATKLSVFSFFTPLMGLGAGQILLDEPGSAPLYGALALVAGGIVLVNLRRTPAQAQPSS